MSAIEIQNLSKWYNGFHALKDVSLSIEKGEFFGYLGPNGAGKTTTINCVVGLSDFQRGSVRVMGMDAVSQHTETKPLIGLAQQEFKFDPFFSIEKMLKYMAGYYGIKGPESEHRVKELLEMFDLDGKTDANVHKLSGGMKRRLQIAKSLVHDPPILILDEPTAGVDVELRHKLWRYFRRLNEEGKTIILTTHYIEEAEKLCDRIGIIDHGEIKALDTKDALMKERSEQTVRIELYEEAELPKQLESLDCSVEAEGKTVLLKCRDAQHVLPKVIDVFSRHKMSIDNVDIIKGKLEDIYLSVTGEKGDFDA